MKYPQLVSTRAVNAISDWLVSRLEQLGVEAPQIYTRLLLSLLQSSVQIYDPIEFSNLETLSANRKWNNRRYLPCDTDTLKKLNAVQCLTGIVSSEQEIATIENLVDELCEKLKDIEKQTADIEDERKLLVATLSLATTTNTASRSLPSAASNNYTLVENHSHHHNHHSHHHNRSRHHSNNKHHINKEQHQQQGQEHNKAASSDIETDPRKRYFRAFPALSKEMDTFRFLRKALTWPIVRRPKSACSAGGEVVSEGEEATESFIEAKPINDEAKEENREECLGAVGVSSGHNIANSSIATRVKRKSKRRRNRALSKGKTIQNVRMYGGAVGRHHYRSSSPSFWDTDFEGCWEMGRDLIKEFISRQNQNRTRNRSTSESAAYNYNNMSKRAEKEEEDERNDTEDEQQQLDVHHVSQLAEQQQRQHHDEETMNDPNVNESIAEKATKATASPSSPLMPIVDISFCCNDECDNTLASISELANNASSLTIMMTANAVAAPPRRLYQREVGGFESNELLQPSEKVSNGATYDDDEQLNFAQFKAKFNSSVEALWNDAVPTEQPVQPETAQGSNMNTYSLGSIDQAISMPNTVAPFTENLKNFWSNYYSHHFDLANLPQQLSQRAAAAAADENCSVSLSCSGVGAAGADGVVTTNDYYSMPANLAEFDKLVGGVRHDRNATPTGLFLSNSIWSASANANGGDTDESFYFKVWNSANKLNQIDVVPHGVVTNRPMPISESSAAAVAFNFPPYNHSKWSEGINAGPSSVSSTIATARIPIQQQLRIQIDNGSSSLKSGSNININNNNNGGNGNLLAIGGGVDCADSRLSTASVSTTSCSSSYTHSSAAAAVAFNWKTPVIGQNLQPDLQSWATSNPMSLTEMYGGGGNVNIVDTSKRIGSDNNLVATTCETVGPNVSLSNHSSDTSGFIGYARIKSVMKILKSTADINCGNANQQNYVAPPRTKERYPEDENLLTSEYTHFHPIKTYVDGHTFDICSSLDSVVYERSKSGYLYFEGGKYLEYTRNDSYMSEEDAASVSGFVSSTPLYASSNCDAAKARNGEEQSKKTNDFVIKFRILRNCDAACQTLDDEVASFAAITELDNHAFSSLISNDAASTNTGFACNDAITAHNKLVAVAAEATAERSENHWLPTASTLSPNNVISVSGLIIRTYAPWTAAQQAATLNIADDTCCDEVNCCANATTGNGNGNNDADDDDVANELCSTTILERQWSMHEIGKRCQLAGHGATGSGTNNNIQTAKTGGANGVAGIINTATTTHTLWSMCAACNSELKSIPANRLLRDELQLEADEIMSDLKYMQDLYIGRAADDDSDDAVSEGSNSSDSNCDAGYDADADAEDSVVDEGKSVRKTAAAVVAKTMVKMEDDNSSDCPQHQQQPRTHVVLQNVNRLIADLLRPDNAERNSKTEDAAVFVTPQRQQCDGGGGGGVASCLWYDHHNEGSIWQPTNCEASAGGGCNNNNNNNNCFPTSSAAALKPIELLRHFNVESSAANALQAEGDTFLSQLSWEHDNLAEIWEKNTPPPASLHSRAADDEANGNVVVETDDGGNKMTIADDTEKILQETIAALVAAKRTIGNYYTTDGGLIVPAATSTNIPTAFFYPPRSTHPAAAAATCKRVQQFLSPSSSETNAKSSAAAKVKLINRKRRHSAALNYYHSPASTIDDTAAAINATTYSSNNNNVDLADLNRFSLTVITSNNQHTATASGSALVFDDIDGDDCNLQKYVHTSKKLQRKTNAASDDIKCDNVICKLEGESEGVADEAAGNIRRIALKYWARIEPPPEAMMPTANDINTDGAKQAACFNMDKNVSILKEVAIATRPLTR